MGRAGRHGKVRWAGGLEGRRGGREGGRVPQPDIQQLRSGDEAAWSEAFGLLWPEAFHAARRRLTGHELADAEDAAVMAIRDAAEKVTRMGTFEELRAMVRLMAGRRAIDLCRAMQAARRGGVEGRAACAGGAVDTEGVVDGGREPWEGVDLLELGGWLAEVEMRLTGTERALIRGHYGEGRTHAELAEAMGMDRATIGVRIRRALGKARRLLASRPGLFRELHSRCDPT